MIILESEPEHSSSQSLSSSSSSLKSSQKSQFLTEKFIRRKKNFPDKKVIRKKFISNKTITNYSGNGGHRKRMAESVNNNYNDNYDEDEDDEMDDEDDDDDDDDDDELEFDASKQPEKEIGSDDNDEDSILPHHFDLAAGHVSNSNNNNIPINYHMADDYSLVIKHVTMDDHANYTCGVYNVAGVRFTRPATLTVFGKLFFFQPLIHY